MLGILPDCCWVEVTQAILTCWGYYQIVNIGVSLAHSLVREIALYNIHYYYCFYVVVVIFAQINRHRIGCHKNTGNGQRMKKILRLRCS